MEIVGEVILLLDHIMLLLRVIVEQIELGVRSFRSYGRGLIN
jgi:hypothetical protein